MSAFHRGQRVRMKTDALTRYEYRHGTAMNPRTDQGRLRIKLDGLKYAGSFLPDFWEPDTSMGIPIDPKPALDDAKEP